MDRVETARLLKRLKNFFPNHFRGLSRKDLTVFLDDWTEALRDYDAEEVMTAACVYATKKKFFPDMADLTAELTRQTPKTAPVVPDSERIKRLTERL